MKRTTRSVVPRPEPERIETEQANLWRERSFPGEWIEVQVEGTWRWQQKQGGSSETS